MKNCIEALKRVWFYLIGNLYAVLFYDKKYLSGEWFEGKHGRMLAPGWRWVYHDGHDRLFHGVNRGVPWPVARETRVVGWENIEFHPDNLNNFQGVGVYMQAMDSKIVIGKGTWIAPGVGIVASNHDIKDPSKRQAGKEVIIGDNSWIGMNAVILPGVVLGDNTVVGAGAVVTKSFPQGKCVIGGNPAKIIKYIDEGEER